MEALEAMVKKYLECKKKNFPKEECIECTYDWVFYEGYKSPCCLLNQADQHLSETRRKS